MKSKPSTIKYKPWVWSLPQGREDLKEKLVQCKLKGGKWLIFVNEQNVNKVWLKIAKATEDNKLGIAAKCSTSSKNKAHVICIYTKDYKDENDVLGIREALRKIGITNKIPYKKNIDTIEGRYSNEGDEKIGEYFS